MQKAVRKQKQEDDLCGICISRKVTANIDCCRHQFCNTCIKGWVKGENKSCPLCRQEVNLITSIKTGRNLYKVRRERERPDVFVPLIRQNIDIDSDSMQQDYDQQVMIQSEIPQRRHIQRQREPRRRQDLQYERPIRPPVLNQRRSSYMHQIKICSINICIIVAITIVFHMVKIVFY